MAVCLQSLICPVLLLLKRNPVLRLIVYTCAVGYTIGFYLGCSEGTTRTGFTH